jgi:hypothetical protein
VAFGCTLLVIAFVLAVTVAAGAVIKRRTGVAVVAPENVAGKTDQVILEPILRPRITTPAL